MIQQPAPPATESIARTYNARPGRCNISRTLHFNPLGLPLCGMQLAVLRAPSAVPGEAATLVVLHLNSSLVLGCGMKLAVLMAPSTTRGDATKFAALPLNSSCLSLCGTQLVVLLAPSTMPGGTAKFAAPRIKGATIDASRCPTSWEPLGEKCSPSGSHTGAPSTARMSSLASTAALTPWVLPAQSVSSLRRRCLASSNTLPRGAHGASGGTSATVWTLREWHAACKRQMSPKIACGDLFLPRSLVPAMMSTRSRGSCASSSKMRPRPFPDTPPTSNTPDASRLATISAAVWPLWPHTETTQAAPPIAVASFSPSIRP
mmetsp:Transcript_117402/g.332643  ORF Transcript_117402/g.332643 Transcript_117402/m.332643 type:complete len:318 (+) Transcript_117402:305-1258(+)